MLTVVIIIYLAASGAAVLAAGNRVWYTRTKPLPMIILAGLIMVRFSSLPFYMGVMLLFVVLFSLAGDVLLLKKSRFLPGLVAFLLAHMGYVFLFLHLTEESTPVMSTVAVFLFAGFSFYMLPRVKKKLKIPVGIYAFILTAMLWRALEAAAAGSMIRDWLPAVGALLFVVSDFILAFNRFIKPLAWAQNIILPTYYLAQLFLVCFFLR